MNILVIGPIKFNVIKGDTLLSNSGISYCVWGWAHGYAENGHRVAILPSLKIPKLELSHLFKKIKLIHQVFYS